MKRPLLLLALAAALCSAAAAEPSTTAYANGWGVDDKTLAFGGGVTVTEAPPGMRGASRATVPASLLGRPVTALAPGLFEEWEALEEVVLPPSLRTIPPRAFRGCRRLRAVELPDAVSEVGERAFEDCVSLRRLALPPGVSALGTAALRGCTGLREADLGACGSVGERAFEGCARLERVRFPSAAAGEIGAGAFRGCRSLREARLGDGAASLGELAFEDCAALEEVVLPPTFAAIGERAFAGCAALRRAVRTEGDGGAERPLRIGERAFAGCTALEAAGFAGDGPRSVGAAAFEGCAALREAWLGGRAESLGEGLFRGCRSLRAAEVPPGATELPADCFADCSALASLKLPGTLVAFGPGALRGCASLRSLALPPQVAAFGDGALRGCTALRRLELPSGAVRFGRGALAGCDALVVAWPSEDPATAAGVPAASLAVRDGTALPAAPAPAPEPPPPPPVAETARERIGPIAWRYRPAPQEGGVEIVAAEVVVEPPFREGRPDLKFTLSLDDDPLLSLGFGAREPADLAVPARLGGRPVAAIGRGALAGLGGAVRIVVPASVRRVDAGAFAAAGLERLVFLGPPPRLAPDWVVREPGDDDPLDFLEYPAASARDWEEALAPALPSARPEAPGAPAGAFVGEEEALGVRWTYSVRDGRAWVGAGPGRPAVPPGTAGALEIPARLGGLPVGGIAPCAFLGMDAIESVRIGGARADFAIGDLAFRGCAALTNLSWDAACAVSSVGAEALRDCTALARFDATGVRRFGEAALAGCTALETLRIGRPDALPPLFAAGCRSLEALELPVGAIGRDAFRGCTALREVRFAPSLRVLGAGAFAGCRALERADVPASCTRVGPGVFDRTPLAPCAGAAAPAAAAAPFSGPVSFADKDADVVATLTAAPDRCELPSDTPACATVRFSLAGVGLPRRGRAPVNLALVLDRSAAMRGEPFERARGAVLAALEGLGPRDAVTLVAFGRRAEVLASGLPATDRARAELAARLRALEPDDAPAAALFGGVAAGAAGLRAGAGPAATPGRLARLVLVAGGPAGAGPAAPGDFRRLGESLAKEGFAVAAVGAGPGCPADALAALADGSGGSVRLPESPAGVAIAVGAEADAALRVAATASTLAVRFLHGAHPVAVSGREGARIEGDVVRADLGPVVLGREAALDVRVEFPARAPGATAPFASAEANWTLPGGGAGAAGFFLAAAVVEPE